MFKNFKMVINMESSMARTHAITLDGIVGGQLAAEGVDGPTAAQTPGYFDLWNGVPMASYMHMHQEWRSIKNSISRSTLRQRTLNSIFMDKLKPGEFRKINGGSSYIDFPAQEIFDVHSSDTVTFFGRGDPEKITELLLRHGFIGSKTSRGYGEIKPNGIDIYDYDADIAGIFHNGNLVRPIPIELMDGRNERYRSDIGRWCNPYSPRLAARYGYEQSSVAKPLEDFPVAE